MSVSDRVRPRKALGQHWLTDSRYLRRIAAAADFGADDTVVEVGAGTGLLTTFLADRAPRLIAVEIDEGLVEGLRRRFAGRENVAVVAADVLERLPEELLMAGGGGVPYVVVGNLPYFVGTAIVRRFLAATVAPCSMIVTLQAEVAESMTAEPGRMTYLAVATQMLASAQILFYLPPRAFTPSPKVRSAAVRLDVLDSPEVEVDNREAFLELVRAGFAAPRKRLRNSLAIGLNLNAVQTDDLLATAGVDPAARPAALSLDGWRSVYIAWRRQEPVG